MFKTETTSHGWISVSHHCYSICLWSDTCSMVISDKWCHWENALMPFNKTHLLRFVPLVAYPDQESTRLCSSVRCLKRRLSALISQQPLAVRMLICYDINNGNWICQWDRFLESSSPANSTEDDISYERWSEGQSTRTYNQVIPQTVYCAISYRSQSLKPQRSIVNLSYVCIYVRALLEPCTGFGLDEHRGFP